MVCIMKIILLLLCAVTLLFTSGCIFPGDRGDRGGRGGRGYSEHNAHGDHYGEHSGDHGDGDYH